MDQASTKKMTPGDDMHLTLLMTPHGLNFVTGQDRQHLLAFGRAAFEAGQKCQGCSVPPNGLHQIAEPSHSMSQYASKDDMLRAALAENERLKQGQANLCQFFAEVCNTLEDVAQGWQDRAIGTTTQRAVEAIKQLAAPQQGLDAQAIERAAQKLAEIAEYNWVQLTEKQCEEFRTDVLSVLTAALGLGHE